MPPVRTGTRLLAVLSLALPITLASISPSRAATGLPDAGEIVRKADEVRFPSYGFQVNITVSTYQSDGTPSLRKYQILSKGNERTLVRTTFPAVDRGQIMLMRDQDLWVFLPKVSQAVRLPLSQKLTGQVANGDLARANFAGDYRATITSEEQIDKDAYYVLLLEANRRGVTYHEVKYWVNKKTYRPYKAEFYTVSKRLIKTAKYEEFKELGGAVRPTKLVLEDTARQGEKSEMVYAEMKTRKLDDKIFTKQYLTKLQ